jgi:preprotein translocase subunit YajC
MLELTAVNIANWTTLALQDTPVQGVLGADSAQPGTAPAGTPGAAAPAGPQGLGLFMPLMILMLVFLFASTLLGGRKEKKRRAAMLGGLKKRDRVQTAGGIIGTIIEIKGDECLLESDRASNTRLWVSRNSVAAVLKSGTGGTETAEAIPDKTTEAAGV